MKVLLINTYDDRGGAAIACNRLMKALQASGVQSKMLVLDSQSVDKDVISVNDSWAISKINKFRFLWERFIIWAINRFSRKNLFAISIANTGVDISRLPEVREADIIHLHWTNHGFLSLRDIKKLVALGKPVVWTMHDMWPATGICHYSRECVRYQDECGNCPFLEKPLLHDLSCRIFKKKQTADFDKITYVACSHWLEERVKTSALLKGVRLLSIPNPIDISKFTLRDKKTVREKYSWSEDKYYLLFGAVKISDPRKGAEYFFRALELLVTVRPELNDKIELVFLGDSALELSSEIPYKANFMGYLSQKEQVIDLYNAVDMFVIPSLEDNLPNTIMESMACGTPVVGFNTGGIPEMIDHKINGYVAEYKNSEDLMAGICWVLLKADYQKLSESSIQKVCACYSEEKVSAQYIDLYTQLIKR